MPLRRWGALLLVALAFLVHTSVGMEQKANEDPQLFYNAIDMRRQDFAKTLEQKYRDLVIKTVVAVNKEEPKRNKDFQRIKQPNTNPYPRDMITMKKGKIHKVQAPRNRHTTLRLLQYNLLAHGLSDKSSGFATIYKESLEECFQLPLHLKTEDELEKWMAEQGIEKGKEFRKFLLTNDEVDEKSQEMLTAEEDIGDIMKAFGKVFAKSTTYVNWENENLLTPKLRELMCAITEGDSEGTYPVPERFNRAIGQVLAHSPDIITLQELDQFGPFKRILNTFDYDGVFFQKEGSQAGRFNGQGKTNSVLANGDKVGSDGAAIFWDKNLFTKLHDMQFNINKKDGKGFNQVCGRVILQRLDNHERIAVYTAHMKSGGSKDKEKKEYQANVIAEHIRNFSEKNPGIRIVFMADFNCHNKAKPKEELAGEDGSTPHAVFHNTIEGEEYIKDKKNWYVNHPHKSWMVSAYKQSGIEYSFTKAAVRDGGEQLPKIENRKDYEEETLAKFGPIGEKNTFGAEIEDYIYFKENGFYVNSVLGIPRYQELGKKLLPNWRHPSDHLHLVADLIYKQLSQHLINQPLVLEKSIECSSCKKEIFCRSDGIAHAHAVPMNFSVNRNGQMRDIILTTEEQKRIAESLSKWKATLGLSSGKKPTDRQLLSYSKTKLKSKLKYSSVSSLFEAFPKLGTALARRRMAQREFSSRRDSPVMVKLLQEIIDAQDD